MYDYQILEADIATLEDIIAIVHDEFPETKGLFQTLLGDDTYLKLLADSKAREKNRMLSVAERDE